MAHCILQNTSVVASLVFPLVLQILLILFTVLQEFALAKTSNLCWFGGGGEIVL